MTTDEDTPDDPSLEAGRSAAQQLGSDWQLDGEQILESFSIPDESGVEYPEPIIEAPPPVPTVEAVPESSPANPTQILEAMLFVGGPPLTASVFCSAVRVEEDVFVQALDELMRRYQRQHRPYSIQRSGEGFVLSVNPAYRGLASKLTVGPRAARLSQLALDVLALVSYRQPISKSEIDAMRGGDSATILRQLVRLGLIVSSKSDEAEGIRYKTTTRFLELFQLNSLEDLPRLGEGERT